MQPPAKAHRSVLAITDGSPTTARASSFSEHSPSLGDALSPSPTVASPPSSKVYTGIDEVAKAVKAALLKKKAIGTESGDGGDADDEAGDASLHPAVAAAASDMSLTGKAKGTAAVNAKAKAKPKAKAKAKPKAKSKTEGKTATPVKCKSKAKAKAVPKAADLVMLGCPKCRGCHSGCVQCRNPGYKGKRYSR